MMTNTKTAYADMMADRTGAAHFWVDAAQRFAKLVIDGRTVARLDRLTDGTVRVTADGAHTGLATWEAGAAWMTARATAAAISTGSLVSFR